MSRLANVLTDGLGFAEAPRGHQTRPFVGDRLACVIADTTVQDMPQGKSVARVALVDVAVGGAP